MDDWNIHLTNPFQLHAATSIMIQNYTYSPGLQYVQLMWNRPVYDPEIYMLYYSCTYHTGEYYYFNKKEEIQNSATTSATVFQLHPRSTCFMTIFAVYNPASNDQGLTITTVTLNEEEAKGKSRNIYFM